MAGASDDQDAEGLPNGSKVFPRTLWVVVGCLATTKGNGHGTGVGSRSQGSRLRLEGAGNGFVVVRLSYTNKRQRAQRGHGFLTELGGDCLWAHTGRVVLFSLGLLMAALWSVFCSCPSFLFQHGCPLGGFLLTASFEVLEPNEGPWPRIFLWFREELVFVAFGVCLLCLLLCEQRESDDTQVCVCKIRVSQRRKPSNAEIYSCQNISVPSIVTLLW